MAYKCRICQVNDVENPNDICELCAIAQDPYANVIANTAGPTGYNDSGSGANTSQPQLQPQPQPQAVMVSTSMTNGTGKGKSRKVLLTATQPLAKRDPYGNIIASPSDSETQVQVYQAGQVPAPQTTTDLTTTSDTTGVASQNASKSESASDTEPICYGITKNISVDKPERSILLKWFQSFFNGLPFPWDDDITMFQIFPDFSGTAVNAQGNACDQVVVYGKIGSGAVAENNDVEIYGYRDSHNNVIVKTIKNKASGTTIAPERTLSATAIRIITFFLFFMVVGAGISAGPEVLIWAVILILCLTNLPLAFKIIMGLAGVVFSFMKGFLSMFFRK